MFEFLKTPRAASRQPPHAFEWWQRSLEPEDSIERITRLRRQLASATTDAGEQPLFLRALRGDIDTELQRVAGRATFEVGESASEVRDRCQLLEETVDHFCDVVASSSRPRDSIEFSDCAREAVAELSGKIRLRLLIQGEHRVAARRGLVTSLFEVAIRSASARTEDEVEVILAPCSGTWAEFQIAWPKSSTTEVSRTQDGYDRARFSALALAYAQKLHGTLRRRHNDDQEILSVRIPTAERLEQRPSPAPSLASVGTGQAVAF